RPGAPVPGAPVAGGPAAPAYTPPAAPTTPGTRPPAASVSPTPAAPAPTAPTPPADPAAGDPSAPTAIPAPSDPGATPAPTPTAAHPANGTGRVPNAHPTGDPTPAPGCALAAPAQTPAHPTADGSEDQPVPPVTVPPARSPETPPPAPTPLTPSAPAPLIPGPRPSPDPVGGEDCTTPADGTLTGHGSVIDPAGLGRRHSVTITVAERLAAVEVDLTLDRADATAGAMAWSTLPGARVTLTQHGSAVVYSFAPAAGEDVAPGTYTFTVQDTRAASPGIRAAGSSWTASGFALRHPHAVAALGGFTPVTARRPPHRA
ncbi:hypothetical protein ACQRUO_25515, partial [Kitasatospora sp. LaBMicrA B282]